MMNKIEAEVLSESAAHDVAFALATIPEFRAPDIVTQRPEAFVRREFSPLLTPAHVDVTHRAARYATPKTFVFPTRKQLRSISADRWMRQRFNAAKTASYNELPSVDYAIDNRASLAPSFRFGRATIESIGIAFANASRCLRINKKIVH